MREKIFNVVFPLWFLLIFPITWLFVLPINFVIDTIVLLCSLKLLNIPCIKEIYKKTILKVWIFGFVADILGSIILLSVQLLPLNGTFQDFVDSIILNPFSEIIGFLIILFGFLISAFSIFLINYYITFKTVEMEVKMKKKVAIILAIFTAPYFFFRPGGRLYRNTNNSMQNVEENYIICEYIDLEV